MKTRRNLLALAIVLTGLLAPRQVLADAMYLDLRVPQPGDHALNVLTPKLLELVYINTRAPGATTVDSWNWVTPEGVFAPPDLSKIQVFVNGNKRSIVRSGFKRRPIHAALWWWDVRIANQLYLELGGSGLNEGATVRVINDGSLWPASMEFVSVAEPLRFNPAIHVNQEGSVPSFPKKAMVGYYLGNLGELPVTANTFRLVDVDTGKTEFEGPLTLRQDVGYTYPVPPYQSVYEADFTSFTRPGRYRLRVPGMGASLPFHIHDGIAMNFARTYALGLLHQRSGFDVAMPFTRFTHAADHLSPAVVPVTSEDPFDFTWATVANYASYVNPDNPPQTAPRLLDPGAQLYPFVNPGPVDVSGGHFEAANYSKPAWNAAQSIHILMFAVDAFPGVANLDNLGIPESGDGISDVMQEAKWEADFLAKMQDADGAFYYMVHPVEREYESNVLPENGDPQVVWPKNTASTAAAVAALTQIASSPRFKQAYPEVADNYLLVAHRGWQFITNALATHGPAGAYQRIMHFDDAFTHNYDIAWAACELFLATGDPQYHQWLTTWFPDPTDPATMRWAWWGMYASHGNAIRSYAAGARSGRLQPDQLDPAYHALCIKAITNWANELLLWSQENAYGSSFPTINKRVRSAGWYYSTEQAFDLAVAQEFSPNPAYVDAIIRNINYETGCNPINVSFVTGLGWKRHREVVDQYSANDNRSLPKIGVPVGNIQEGFPWTGTYGGELSALTFPSDGGDAPYPFYDRWADFWNVSTEASTANTVRSFATTVWLAAQTPAASEPWRFTSASIFAPTTSRPRNQPLTVQLQVDEPDLTGARIIWEAQEQQPAFGGLTYTFTPGPYDGPYWIEAEVHWPDGRRAFAKGTVNISAAAPPIGPEVSAPRIGPDGRFSFLLSGIPGLNYEVEASSDLRNWTTVTTQLLPESGVVRVIDTSNDGSPLRYYRALSAPAD